MTEKSTTEKLAAEASDLHYRLYDAYLAESSRRDNHNRKVGDPRRIERLLRLAHMAADRWRRVMGIEPVYGKGGTR